MDHDRLHFAEQGRSSEPPPRFSVQRRAAIQARLMRSIVPAGGCRSVLSLAVVARMHLFDKAHYTKFLRQACRSARENAGEEICGLIVDTGCHLSFVPTRNVSQRDG